MSFARIIAVLAVCSNLMFSILPSDLVFTPYSEFPGKNQSELGYHASYYSVQATTNDKGLYFHHSFSDNIRYGADFYQGSDKYQIFHHFAYRMGSLFKKTNYNLIFSVALNYLSTEKPVLANRNLYAGSLTTTWRPHLSPFSAHGTIARKIYSDDLVIMAALTFQQKWGILALEWDAGFLNISSQFELFKRIKFRGGITKNMNDSSELIFKTGIGFFEFNMFESTKDSTPKEDAMKEKIATIDTSVGLKHVQEGMKFFYDGEYRKAQKSYEIAVEFFPESAIVRERLGSIYFKLSDYENAQIQWEKANVIEPSARLKKYILEAKEKGESLY